MGKHRLLIKQAASRSTTKHCVISVLADLLLFNRRFIKTRVVFKGNVGGLLLGRQIEIKTKYFSEKTK